MSGRWNPGPEPGFYYAPPEDDITATLARGRWVIVAGGEVVEILTLDPTGRYPSHIYRDVALHPEVDVGWRLVDDVFLPPAT